MRILLIGLVVLAACGDDSTSDLLELKTPSNVLTVGEMTIVEADLVDPVTDASMITNNVSWSTDPGGIVTLSQSDMVQTVTAVGSGEVVVSANGYNQTAKIGFTVN